MKLKLIFTLVFSLMCCYSFAQFQIGHTSVTFIDSSRSNRAVLTEIYYPADAAGENVAFSSAMSGKAPLISFGHGFVMTYDAYYNFRDAVVPRGYIIAFPVTEGSLSPNHNEFGKDLAFVLQAVTRLSGASTSVFYGKVDTMNCVMGHSMGGGAAVLAMSYNPAIKAIVTFAAAETTPSAISATPSISAPALMFAGLNDCVTPPATNQQPMYDGLVSGCKHFIGIKGGSHCQMAESSVTCSFGEATCTPPPAITRATQHKVIDTLLLPWLDYTLKASCAAGNYFNAKLTTDTAITFQKNCDLCGTASVTQPATTPNITVSPNPATNQVFFDAIPECFSTLSVIDLSGKRVAVVTVKGKTELSVVNLPSGTYIYELTGPMVNPSRGLLQIVR